jgi:hypothetical protein
MSLTDDYLATAITRGPKPSAIRAAMGPQLDATAYMGRCLSRPVFLEATEYHQLARDLDLLHSALTRIPERLFGGDLAAFALEECRGLRPTRRGELTSRPTPRRTLSPDCPPSQRPRRQHPPANPDGPVTCKSPRRRMPPWPRPPRISRPSQSGPAEHPTLTTLRWVRL